MKHCLVIASPFAGMASGGAIIDHNKGTGYNYPDSLPVVIGQSIAIDRAQQNAEEQKSAANP